MARRYHRVREQQVLHRVTAGAGATKMLQELAGHLRGGLDSPLDPDAAMNPTPAAAGGKHLRGGMDSPLDPDTTMNRTPAAAGGKHQGAANWNASILRLGGGAQGRANVVK